MKHFQKSLTQHPGPLGGIFLAFLVLTASCSPAPVPDTSQDQAQPEENLKPSDLTGTALKPTDYQIHTAYVHGGPLLTTATQTTVPLTLHQSLSAGEAISTPPGAEAELYVQTDSFTDGVVRVGEKSWVVLEKDNRPERPQLEVSVYGGQTGYFIPPGNQDLISIWTPAGRLVSRGGMFTVTVSPEGQVLVSTREGEVNLEGQMTATATPGRALALMRPGSWTYKVPGADVAQLQDRWDQVMSEQSPPFLKEELATKLPRLQFFLALAKLPPFFEREALTLMVWAFESRTLAPDPSLPTADDLTKLWQKAAQTRAAQNGIVWPLASSLSAPPLLGLNP